MNAAQGRMGYYRELWLAHLNRKRSIRFSCTKSTNTELLGDHFKKILLSRNRFGVTKRKVQIVRKSKEVKATGFILIRST